jgi:hypothetical protein
MAWHEPAEVATKRVGGGAGFRRREMATHLTPTELHTDDDDLCARKDRGEVSYQAGNGVRSDSVASYCMMVGTWVLYPTKWHREMPPRLANAGETHSDRVTTRMTFLEVGNLIWNTFHYCNFFQISTDFELFKRF